MNPHCIVIHRIFCNFDGFVEKLDLSNMNLSGIVSDRVLTYLKIIDVSQNNFVGKFPYGVGEFAGMISINPSSNNFEGLLPFDLVSASSLESLDLRGSFFEGSIPSSFNNL
ncbi:hypothetical protein ACS0TY_032065 [Phlomoides rotata]